MNNKQIYNEGRVVGLSAYEVYLKQYIAETGSSEGAASEREWLSASLAFGSSMIVRIPEGSVNYFSAQLPLDSKLRAANTIIASYFKGECEIDLETNFAVAVTHWAGGSWADKHIARLKNYLKISDGIVYQKNIDTPPTIEIYLEDAVVDSTGEDCPYVLLTGFTNVDVLLGEAKLDEATAPHDGDFLGPQYLPKKSKIIFTTPPGVEKHIQTLEYGRWIPEDASKALSQLWAGYDVENTSLIDLKSVDFGDYYNAPVDKDGHLDILKMNTDNSTISYGVYKAKNYVGENLSVLTVTQRHKSVPPALYASKVSGDTFDATDAKKLYPIDTNAPGTVKMFSVPDYGDEHNEYYETMCDNYEQMALDYFKNVPNSCVFVQPYSPYSYTIYQLITNYDKSTGETIQKLPIARVDPPNSSNTPYSIITAGNNSTYVLSLADKDGNLYDKSGSGGTVEVADIGKLCWNDLINALQQNKSISLTFDPNSYKDVDITELFIESNASYDKPVEFSFGYCDNLVNVGLIPWDGTSDFNKLTSSEMGYFTVKVRLYNTSAGTTSKFDVIISAYLKQGIKLTKSDTYSGQHLAGSGFIWRGQTNDTSETFRPLFYKEDDSIGVDANYSDPIIAMWENAPEGNSISNGMQILADSCAFGWGANLTIQGNRRLGDTNNEKIRLIDRSYSFNTNASQLSTYMISTLSTTNSDYTFSKGTLPSEDFKGVATRTWKISGIYATI